MEKKELCLDFLKEKYSFIQKKHNLPSFDVLNEDFQVEALADHESDFLIREIRKTIAEKFSALLRFIDVLVNPSNAPMFVFPLIKSINNGERKKLEEIYKFLIREEVNTLELDLKFDEKKEAEYINESYKNWQTIREDAVKIVQSIKNNLDKKTETNNKNYFG